MKQTSLLYQIGLTLLPGIGVKLAKNLVAYTGSVEGVFKQKIKILVTIPGINYNLAKAIVNHAVLKRAEAEIKFIEKNNIQTRFYLDDDYPNRLKYCDDNPILLFAKGNFNWNPEKLISIVGTRNATEYGYKYTNKFVEGLKEANPYIISGMAYGIDITAHRAALKNDLTTIAIVGHGLDRMYPALHKPILDQMMENGGVITEFLSETIPDRENFPKRNRIIAGLSDATLVVESGRKGGSIITAELALSYSRDVFAIPGNLENKFSIGCNSLIHTQKATLVRGPNDILKVMNWFAKRKKKTIQKSLFIELTESEQVIYDELRTNGSCPIDELTTKIGLSMSKTSVNLLNLEFKGVVKTLPGKVYSLA
ncbi:MAG: DNA-protecting protein DprA [Epsilonproteobacteria bacterium]|nr:MAG: DNA-protecting protein DprA [Campylobacterota bacterium]